MDRTALQRKQKQVHTASYLLKSTQAVNYRVDGDCLLVIIRGLINGSVADLGIEHVFSG